MKKPKIRVQSSPNITALSYRTPSNWMQNSIGGSRERTAPLDTIHIVPPRSRA
jgi:hypothetical protein